MLILSQFQSLPLRRPHQDGLVISMSISHAVGHGFMSQSSHTKDNHILDEESMGAITYPCVNIQIL